MQNHKWCTRCDQRTGMHLNHQCGETEYVCLHSNPPCAPHTHVCAACRLWPMWITMICLNSLWFYSSLLPSSSPLTSSDRFFSFSAKINSLMTTDWREREREMKNRKKNEIMKLMTSCEMKNNRTYSTSTSRGTHGTKYTFVFCLWFFAFVVNSFSICFTFFAFHFFFVNYLPSSYYYFTTRNACLTLMCFVQRTQRLL